MDVNKTDNFLNAIQKYADQQKLDMQKEIEAFKVEEMDKAEKEGLQAAYNIIHEEMAIQKAEIARDLAKKEKQSKDQLFIERKHIMEEVFTLTTEKLISYTQSAEYEQKLLKQAESISEIFKNQSCIVYVKENDLKFSDKLKAYFSADTQVMQANDIKIGGIKVYCQSKAIIADETLDSKLLDQKQWFIENSNLQVV